MKKIVVCGGGNIAHSLAAVISLHRPVTILTRRPEGWSSRLSIAQSGNRLSSRFDIAATSDVAVVQGADILFIALPQFAFEETLDRIVPWLGAGTTVVFVPAPAKAAEYEAELAARGCTVVGMQRVPFIARTVEYGREVSISAPRRNHRIAVSNDGAKQGLARFLPKLFNGDVAFLSSFRIFAFSNSNPLLHPARLVELLRGGDAGTYSACPYFYAEWTDASSDLYVNADREMFACLRVIDPRSAATDYESVLEHYGVGSCTALTEKIRNIQSFKSIKAPWKQADGGRWTPDFTSRDFTEDIPFGTKVIQDYARKAGIETPTIDYLIENCLSLRKDVP